MNNSTYNDLPFNAGIHEKSGQDKIVYNLERFKKRVSRNKPVLIGVDGAGLGEGKTTLAVHLADYFEGSPIDLKQQLSMGGQDFLEKLEACRVAKKKVIIYDEANDFNRKASLTRASRNLQKAFDTFRAYNMIIIIVLPTVLTLDPAIFQNKVFRMLFHVYGRTETYARLNAYDIRRVLDMRRYARKNKEIDDFSRYYKNEPSFYGIWWNLPPDRAAELDALSTKAKIDINTRSALEASELKNTQQISEIVGRKFTTVRDFIYESRMAPSMRIKNTPYYNQDQIKAIAEYFRTAKKRGGQFKNKREAPA